MRGEHLHAATMIIQDPGSSPHARGAPAWNTRINHDVGIIPACAGSTDTSRIKRPRIKDHPRMRGEHGCLIARNTLGGGIIPACAGSTCL